MSAKRYTLTIRGDDYGVMSGLSEVAEALPGVETGWFVATDDALERARLADELFPAALSSEDAKRPTPKCTCGVLTARAADPDPLAEALAANESRRDATRPTPKCATCKDSDRVCVRGVWSECPDCDGRNATRPTGDKQ